MKRNPVLVCFGAYLKVSKIVKNLETPYNPQQKDVAERKFRTVLEKVPCFVIAAVLPPAF